MKDVVEERLFAHRCDLLTELDLVFMGATSLYFEGTGLPALIPVIDRLRARFAIARVCVVADRGMIIAELETRWVFYILGVRERMDKLVRELVLDDPAPFVPMALTDKTRQGDRLRGQDADAWQGTVTSSAATIRKRRKTRPTAPRSSLRLSGDSPRATRR